MNKQTKIFLLCIVFIAIFGIIDSKQIVPFQISQEWEDYTIHIAPNFIFSWVLALAGIAITYYILVKDKSESIGIFAAGYLMLCGGTEDVSFFLLSHNNMAAQMCWFKFPINFISTLFGETCVSPLTLILNSSLFIYLAWLTLKLLWRQKW